VADLFVEQVVRAEPILQTEEILGVVLIRDEQQAGVELAVGVEAVGAPTMLTMRVASMPSRRPMRNVPTNTPCMHSIPVPRSGTTVSEHSLTRQTPGSGVGG
jgi:hypothetical protein